MTPKRAERKRDSAEPTDYPSPGALIFNSKEVTMTFKRPDLIMSSVDVERLEEILDNLHEDDFPGKIDLEEELARATVVPPNEVPPDVVTMNSTVFFETKPQGKKFTLTLVYPTDTSIVKNSISVLAPVGSALLGLSIGDEIEWPRPGGGKILLQIIDITYQPERRPID